MSDQQEHEKFLEQIDKQIAVVSKGAVPIIDQARKILDEEGSKLVEQMTETPVELPTDLSEVDPDTCNRNLAQINRRTQMLQHTQARMMPHIYKLRTAVVSLKHLVEVKTKSISVKEGRHQPSAFLSKAFGELRCVDEAQVLAEGQAELANIEQFIRMVTELQSSNGRTAQDIKYQHKIIDTLEAGANLGTEKTTKKKKPDQNVDPLDLLGESIATGGAGLPEETTVDFSKITGNEPVVEASPDAVDSLVEENTLDWEAPGSGAAPVEKPPAGDVDDALADLFSPSPTGASLTTSDEEDQEINAACGMSDTPAPLAEEVEDSPTTASPADPAPSPYIEDEVEEAMRWRVFREMGMEGSHLKLGLYPSKLIEAVMMETVGVAKLGKNAGFHKDQTGDEEQYELFKKFIKEFAEAHGIIQRHLKDPEKPRQDDNLSARYELAPLGARYEEHWRETLVRVQEIAAVSRPQVTEGEAVADLLEDLGTLEEVPEVGAPVPATGTETKPLSGSHAMLERKGDENVNPMDLILGSPTEPSEVTGDPVTADDRDKGYEEPLPSPDDEPPAPGADIENTEDKIYFVYLDGKNEKMSASELQRLVNETGKDHSTQLRSTPGVEWFKASKFGIVVQTDSGPPPPVAAPPAAEIPEPEAAPTPEPAASTANIDDILEGLD